MPADPLNGLTVAVCGGGIFGVTAALELRRRGAEVTVFDAGAVPNPRASTTDISKVVRADYGSDDLFTELMWGAIERWRSWNEEAGEELFHEDGFLILRDGEPGPGDFEYESFARLGCRTAGMERLGPDDVAQRYPAWGEGDWHGYFNPRAGWAESGRVLAWLAERCRAAGVELVEDAPVESLQRDAAAVTGVVARGRSYHADRVLVAAGAWTPQLVPGLDELMWSVAQPVIHLRPQRLAHFSAPQLPPWAADISRSGYYGFCGHPSEGVLKIANHGVGQRVSPERDPGVTEAQVAQFRAFVARILPDLAEADLVGTRACFYCDTWDGNFLIDRHPELDGLTVATGGSGHAFKFAPLMGTWVADAVQGGSNEALERFAWREAQSERTEDARNA